jgi:diketogulonate reductase-like aldo/keto reductase
MEGCVADADAADAVAVPTCTLSSGHSIPMVGLGTWKSGTENEVGNAVKWALEAGYKHLDCAACYQNEPEVGAAIAESLAAGLKREDIFITSKLWNSEHDPAHVKAAVQASIRDLQCQYLDLYLVHWPQNWEHVEEGAPLPHMSFSKNEDGSLKYTDVPLMDTWNALEACVDEGLIKSIGLSNFNETQIQEICHKGRIKPAVLQVEIHPFFQQEPLLQFAKAAGLAVTAYSPLGSGVEIHGMRVIDHPDLAAIGEKHGKSAAQVVTAWLLARGIVVIPKSVKQERIQQNLDVIFQLDEEDMSKITTLNADARAGWGGPQVERDGKLEARDIAHPQYPFK